MRFTERKLLNIEIPPRMLLNTNSLVQSVFKPTTWGPSDALSRLIEFDANHMLIDELWV
nr:7885_t:CDS:2 [Entrophospora candida]